jgi:hypothetical protein
MILSQGTTYAAAQVFSPRWRRNYLAGRGARAAERDARGWIDRCPGALVLRRPLARFS